MLTNPTDFGFFGRKMNLLIWRLMEEVVNGRGGSWKRWLMEEVVNPEIY